MCRRWKDLVPSLEPFVARLLGPEGRCCCSAAQNQATNKHFDRKILNLAGAETRNVEVDESLSRMNPASLQKGLLGPLCVESAIPNVLLSGRKADASDAGTNACEMRPTCMSQDFSEDYEKNSSLSRTTGRIECTNKL